MQLGRWLRAGALLAVLAAAACGGGKGAPRDGGAGGIGGGGGGTAGSGGGGVVGCLDMPGALDRPPNGTLPCELIPPGLRL